MKNERLKRGTYYECLKCGDKIYYDTNKKMVDCKCGAIAIDGCEFYIRIIGDEKDYKSISIDEKGEEIAKK